MTERHRLAIHAFDHSRKGVDADLLGMTERRQKTTKGPVMTAGLAAMTGRQRCDLPGFPAIPQRRLRRA